jgi:hypothetical protein
VSDWNVPSTWSNCTGPAVWLIGIVSPSPISGAEGEPGLRSTKKLPSKMMRGRILRVASLWIGIACLSMRMVILAAGSPPPTWSTFVTLPTLTPAMRTR